MNDKLVQLFDLTVRTQVTAMGMQAQNEVCRIREEYPAYDKNDFDMLVEQQIEEFCRIHKGTMS